MGAPVGNGTLVNSSATLTTYTDSNGGSAYTVGSGSNRAVIITVSGYLDTAANAGGVSAMTFGTHTIANGQIVALGSVVQNSATWVQNFVIVNPTAGSSSFSVTASFSQRAMVAKVAEYNDIDQTTPVGSNIGTYSNASSATATGTLTTTAANSTLHLGTCHEADWGTVTAGDGGTLIASTATNGGTAFSDCTGAISYEVLTGSSGVSVSTSISGTDTDNTVGQLIELIPAAGGTPAGLATEADTALALAAVQVRAAGLATETDTALALTAVQIAPAGLASETDSALALSPVQIAPAGLASETDSALALGGVHILAAGLATETDTGLGLAAVHIRAAGLATETDIALALDPASGLGVGIAIETDSALALTAVQIAPAGLATETDTALALTPVQVRAAGLASETDEALAPGGVHILAAGIAIEVDAALALVAVAASGPPRRTVIPPGRAIQPGRPGQTTYRRPPNISRGTG